MIVERFNNIYFGDYQPTATDKSGLKTHIHTKILVIKRTIKSIDQNSYVSMRGIHKITHNTKYIKTFIKATPQCIFWLFGVLKVTCQSQRRHTLKLTLLYHPFNSKYGTITFKNELHAVLKNI